MEQKIIIRAAKPEDAQALLDIYGYYVEKTAITYEYEIPTLDEFKKRIIHTLESYPYLVAEADGKIVGYAYAGFFRTRAAYGWDAELTVYIDKNARGMGIGRKLYDMLEAILKEQGIVNVVAVLTPPENTEDDSVYNSKHFHERQGYRLAGQMENCGYKFNRWYTTALMYKTLCPPAEKMQPIKKFNEARGKFGI
mgnify:FL=1